MLFLVSLLLLIWVSMRWASRLASSPADRYWVFVGTGMLQVGAVTSFTSAIHQLTPVGWVLTQLGLVIVSTPFTGGWPGRKDLLAVLWRWRLGLVAFASGLSAWSVLLLGAIGVVVLLTMVLQVATPIQNFDDRMYHASRVLYWIQHRTVFPFETHNIRQTLVPFGSELYFLWPILLTQIEAMGRLVFWLALPLVATGQYVLLRALKIGQTASLAGVLVLMSTPMIIASASGLKPEIWSVLALLGVAYWAVSIVSGTGSTGNRYFFLGVFAVLGINVRSFPAVLLPSLLLILWCAPCPVPPTGRLKRFAAGLLCAGALSALLIPLTFNTVRYHHPMGPPEVQRVVRADLTPQTVYTHAVRFAFLLLELPDAMVSSDTRERFSNAGNRLITTLGADKPLTGEASDPWPGRFVYALPEHATRFSLWGLLWLPVLGVAAWRLVRNLAATWPQVRLTSTSALTLLAISLLGAVLFGARWMAQSEVPGRFLSGPYALTLPLGMALLAPYFSGRWWVQVLLAVVVAYAAHAPIQKLANDALRAVATPPPDADVDEPFHEVLGSAISGGSRLLFVGDQDARDYPLFSPRTRYSNTVISWGSRPFDPDRMRSLIANEKVTHVLIQNDRRIEFHWFPSVDTREMVAWLNAEPGLRPIPLRSPGIRLYEVTGVAVMNEAPFAVTEFPAASPLIVVANPLRQQVGVELTETGRPWPVEALGDDERGFLWLGQGYAEGLEFALWSRQERDVDIRLQVSPGHGLTTPGRRFMLLHDDRVVGGEYTFHGAASILVRTRLHAGRNLMGLLALDTATVNPLPNGDVRNLVIGLHELRIEAPTDAVVDRGPHHAGEGELARSARLAVGLINRRQQADGYWHTAYTGATAFDRPLKEMNTYVTALMVDLLGALPNPAGVEGSLARARTHLHRQIESSGLVRYHGNPGGRAAKESGACAITPDADDTALTWRIAPGADALLPAVLEVLRRFRTEDGLYKTWLGRRDEYNCLDPGADPNPSDLVIQMHVLMWLAQVDPPAARSLCQALRRTVDQDRLWVYYSKAPLVPVLRQPDLRAAGCDLPLPLARLQIESPSQEVWQEAARMLVRLQGESRQAPPREQVLHWLQRLSQDGFARLRENPPMLYHNDLSATVPRFYWSEDVGYAIWLRLYRSVEGQP